MLMILSVDPWSDLSTKRRRIFSLRENIDVQDPRQPNLMLDSSILIEVVVETVLVIGDGTDHADHQSARTDGMNSTSRSKISMFPEKTCVFFVDTYGILDVDCVPVVPYI